MPLYRRLPKRGFLPHGGKHRVRRRESQGARRPSRRAAWSIPTASCRRGLISARPRPGEDPRRRRRRPRAHRARARGQRVGAGQDRGARAAASRCCARRGGGGLVIESLQSFQNVFKIPELKRRVLFTAGAARRLPPRRPRADARASTARRSPQFFDQVQGTLLGMVDLFSGGDLGRLRSSRSASCRTSRRRSSCSC